MINGVTSKVSVVKDLAKVESKAEKHGDLGSDIGARNNIWDKCDSMGRVECQHCRIVYHVCVKC